MRHHRIVVSILFIMVLFLSSLTFPPVKSCKDIVAVGEATNGNYNLLLKVRDPSREGLQVLCRVPKGYVYTYHHPWTGKTWEFTVLHTFLGVATQGDSTPNIVKAGMVLSDSGLAYGDADTGSHWKNPTKYAWDDFDWIRYACQQAATEEEAIYLLTNEAVDQLHASAVSENLFVVGPTSAAVIEADAFHSTVTAIDNVHVMSNYPRTLWRTQLIQKLPLAISFDTTKKSWVTKGRIIRLNSLCGIQITEITENAVVAKPFPYFVFEEMMNHSEGVTIPLGERGLVGPYSVKLLAINGRTAQISMSYMMKAWEEQMLEYVMPAIGHITVETMMNWSRLHSQDLEGLRPMCEDRFPYEAAMIYKIPTEYPDVLSTGWFAANHACSSIYIPVHICDTDFYDPYKTGEAAALSLELLHQYGHGTLSEPFHNVEKVLLFETDITEAIARELIGQQVDVSEFLTTIDKGIQKQVFLTEQLWLHLQNLSGTPYYAEIQNVIEHIWVENYTGSIIQMKQAINSLKQYPGSTIFINIIENILRSIYSMQSVAMQVLEPLKIYQEDITRMLLPSSPIFDRYLRGIMDS